MQTDLPARSSRFVPGPALPWEQPQEGLGLHQAVLILTKQLVAVSQHAQAQVLPIASISMPHGPRVKALIAESFQLPSTQQHGSTLPPAVQDHGRAIPLFSIARMAGDMVPGFDSSDAASDSSDVDDDDSSDGLHMSSDEDLHRLKCGICRQQLLPRRGKLDRRRQHVTPRVKICDACHNGYHASCCRRKQRGTQLKEGLSGPAWYCSDACMDQHTRMLLQCERGDTPLPVRLQPPAGIRQPWDQTSWDQPRMLASKGRAGQAGNQPDVIMYEGEPTWQLAQGNARLGSTQWNALADAVSVLSHEYGPFVIRQIEGSDYVAVLRRGGEPVTAATLDCFGGKGCTVDLLCTQPDARLQGHARGLVSTLQHVLASILPGSAGQLMAVVSEPSSADGKRSQAFWQRHLGFSKLTNRQVHQLQGEVPMMAAHGDGVAVFAKRLLQATSSGISSASHQPPSTLWKSAGTKLVAPPSNQRSSQTTSLVGRSASPADDPPPRRTRPRRSYWRLRLWGWALRRVVRAGTFGLLG